MRIHFVGVVDFYIIHYALAGSAGRQIMALGGHRPVVSRQRL